MLQYSASIYETRRDSNREILGAGSDRLSFFLERNRPPVEQNIVGLLDRGSSNC